MSIKVVGQVVPHFAPFYMVWQNTVAIKDLSKASLLCLVFQEDAGRTWDRFFYLVVLLCRVSLADEGSLYVEMKKFLNSFLDKLF